MVSSNGQMAVLSAKKREQHVNSIPALQRAVLYPLYQSIVRKQSKGEHATGASPVLDES